MDDWYVVSNYSKKGRKGKKRKRILRKTGKNIVRKRGKKIKRRRKKIKRIIEKRAGSWEKKIIRRIARAKWD